VAADDKDARLGQEIQYLGRLLGDVSRTANGEPIFEKIEHIRKLAVALRRDTSDTDIDSLQQQLEQELAGLGIEQTLSVVRAFSHFSLLANVAEDRQSKSPPPCATAGGSAPQLGSLRHALDALAARNISVAEIRGWLQGGG